MQLRWIAIGMVCFSAALLSACGGAAGDASLSSRTEASALSSKQSDRSHDAAKGDDSKDHDKDDCDCDDDSSKSRSKDDDKTAECKDDDHDRDHDKSKDKSRSLSVSSSLSTSWKSNDKSKDSDKDNEKDDDGSCKVTICHRPPGNRCNEHTIRVGKSAVSAHVAHGDYPGSCDPQDPPPPPPPPVTNSCDPALCPVPADANAVAICDTNGQCSSMCAPPTTLVGGVCTTLGG